MKISIIAAMAKHQVIGAKNKLPWHLPADLQHFKAVTMTKPIVMGHKTYQSIGKPLPGRRNIVISRDPNLTITGCDVVNSLSDALMVAGDDAEIMIIGGAAIFEQALSYAECMYLTYIHAELPGDVYFPAWDEQQWLETERVDHQADENNPHDYSFVILNRRGSVEKN